MQKLFNRTEAQIYITNPRAGQELLAQKTRTILDTTPNIAHQTYNLVELFRSARENVEKLYTNRTDPEKQEALHNLKDTYNLLWWVGEYITVKLSDPTEPGEKQQKQLEINRILAHFNKAEQTYKENITVNKTLHKLIHNFVKDSTEPLNIIEHYLLLAETDTPEADIQPVLVVYRERRLQHPKLYSLETDLTITQVLEDLNQTGTGFSIIPQSSLANFKNHVEPVNFKTLLLNRNLLKTACLLYAESQKPFTTMLNAARKL